MSHQSYFTDKENPDERILKLIKRKAENVEFLVDNIIPSSQAGFGSSGVSRGVDLDDVTTTVVDANVINLPDGSLTDDGDHEATIDLVISMGVVEGVPFSGAVELGQSDGSVVIIQTDGLFEFSTSAEIIPLENLLFTPTYTTVQDAFTVFGSTGLISGGVISDGGSETVDVAALTGFLRSTDDHVGDIFTFDFAGSTGHAIPTNSNRWLGIEYNAGTPQVIIKSVDTWNLHNEFPIGCVTNESGTLHIKTNPAQIANFGAHSSIRWYESEPLARANRFGGLIIGETGVRNVSITAGTFFDRLNKFPVDAIDTSGADTFDSYVDDILESAGDSQWDNANYNNGGVLTPLGNNKYAVLWFYLESDGGLLCTYGTDQYVSLAGAAAESPPSLISLRIQCHGRLIGRILFQEGAVIPEIVESVFDVQFSASGVTDHNNLANLQGGAAGEYFHLTNAEYIGLWNKGNETTCAIGLTVIDLGAISDDAWDHQVNLQYRTGLDGHVLQASGNPHTMTHGAISYFHYKDSGNLKVAVTNDSGTDVEATAFYT